MIGALARAGFHLSNEAYIERARRAKDFIFKNMLKGDVLHRIHSAAQEDKGEGKPTVEAFLEDYAYLTQALIDLFEATGDAVVLKEAQKIMELTLADFGDEEKIGFYFTRAGQKDVIVRTRAAHDGATPAAQGVVVMNLLRLGALLGNRGFTERAVSVLKRYHNALADQPRAFTTLVRCLDFYLNEPREIVVVGWRGDKKWGEFVRFFKDKFLPFKVLAIISLEDKDIWSGWEAYQDKLAVKEASVFVCRNHVCEKPVTDLDRLLRVL